MDEFQRLAVKIPNSVLVESISDTDSKIVKLLDAKLFMRESEFDGQVVVEFSSGVALTELCSILLYSLYSSEKK